jgi:hypothetical protein
MTLPAKSRRTIVVDNVSYYWTRGRSDGWVTIQHSSGRGPLLRIDLWGIPLPVDIANGIRFAIANGWSPTEGDKPMYLGFNDKEESERFVLRSADSPDYWREFVGRDVEVNKGKE